MPGLLRSKFSARRGRRAEVASSGDRFHSIRRGSTRTGGHRAPLALAFIVLGALLGPLRLTRVRVAGPSMLPTLAEGERLLARRVRRLRTGDLVVCRSPLEPDRLLVKRVAGIEGRQIRVQGDNAGASTDSRAFGPIDRREVLGVVCYRYAPPEAAGWLHRPSH